MPEKVPSSNRSLGKTLHRPTPGPSRPSQDRAEKEKELQEARIQFARLCQRYNRVASRIQGATRRKLLLRAIRREQMRIEMLERELSDLISS